MEYRAFGKNGFDSSIIGLGTMRLPVIEGGSNAEVDEPKAIAMIRKAIDEGVNYIDTAYIYHDGNSERVIGKALKDGYREKVILVDKNPVWLVNTYEDFEKYLMEQLDRLQTDYLDVYLLHALDKKSWEKTKKLGGLEFLMEQMEKGRIKVPGFSMHDDFETFKDIIGAFDWGMTLLQMNYMDEFNQATLEGVKLAGELGIPVAIMEPLKGGLLAHAPDDVKTLYEKSGRAWKPVEWSFQWLASQPEVKVILSGMSNEEQLMENIEIATRLNDNSMTEADFELLKKVRETYHSRVKVPCTECRYCMPCPFGVDIPRNFKLYNTASIYDNLRNSAYTYQKNMKKDHQASSCVACRKCESHCPQSIIISERLNEVADALGREGNFDTMKWNF